MRRRRGWRPARAPRMDVETLGRLLTGRAALVGPTTASLAWFGRLGLRDGFWPDASTPLPWGTPEGGFSARLTTRTADQHLVVASVVVYARQADARGRDLLGMLVAGRREPPASAVAGLLAALGDLAVGRREEAEG